MGARPELSEVPGLTGRRRFIQAGAALALAAAAAPRVHADSAIQALLEDARTFLGSIREPHLQSFMNEWPESKRRPELRAVVPSSLPVLRWLPEARRQAPPVTAGLVDDVMHAAPSLAWRQTYDANQIGRQFLDNYGWAEILGLTGPRAGDRLACGFLLLGPSTAYPSHRHEALEIYIPITGTASWLRGGHWREQRPGTVIYHASEEVHAMRTGAQPLLALYLWRSDNLNQKSRFVTNGES